MFSVAWADVCALSRSKSLYSQIGICCLDNDMVTMFEEAYKKQPGNEDLGAQTFFANVRASHWKSAHNVRVQLCF